MKEFYETNDGRKLTRDEYNEYMTKGALAYDPGPELSNEEEAYRRGFSHGFQAAITHNATHNDARKVNYWAKGRELTAPPFTPYAGRKLPGLTKELIA